METLTSTDLLPLQLFLAKQLPEEIVILGDTPPQFRWRNPLKDFYTDCIKVTPREWDYIVWRVKEKLTELQRKEFCRNLKFYQILEAEGSPDWVSTHVPWTTSTLVLMKVI